MKIFIIFAHHELKSFNGAMLNVAKTFFEERGDTVVVSDLYRESFDPVSDRRNFTTVKDSTYLKQQTEEMHASENNGFSEDIVREFKKVEDCDLLIMQFPLWWFGVPAILKGWVDRVFAMGLAYGGGRWYDEGVFKGKRAMLSLTTGGPESMYSEQGLNGDINMLLYPINHGILRFTGFDVLNPHIAWGPSRAGDDGRQQYLDDYRARLSSLNSEKPISYPSLSEFDMETFARK